LAGQQASFGAIYDPYMRKRNSGSKNKPAWQLQKETTDKGGQDLKNRMQKILSPVNFGTSSDYYLLGDFGSAPEYAWEPDEQIGNRADG
jgi:hypothetical protein